jgi:transcriptional regulator with XRE-family HTH domain
MLGMSQTALADGIGVTFQQVQKYEKGANRIGSGRLQQIADTLAVPASFFFEGVPSRRQADGDAPSFEYMDEFLSSTDGFRIAKAFLNVKNQELRRKITLTIEAIADSKSG